MPIKTTKLKDILTREQVYPETNVASIVDFNENVDHVSVSDQGSSETEVSYITINGTEHKIAGSDLSGFDVNQPTELGDDYLTSLSFKGKLYRVAGDASEDLAAEIARAKAKEAELQEYISYLYSKLNLELGSELAITDEEGNAESFTVVDENGEPVQLIVDLDNSLV